MRAMLADCLLPSIAAYSFILGRSYEVLSTSASLSLPILLQSCLQMKHAKILLTTETRSYSVQYDEQYSK